MGEVNWSLARWRRVRGWKVASFFSQLSHRHIGLSANANFIKLHVYMYYMDTRELFENIHDCFDLSIYIRIYTS